MEDSTYIFFFICSDANTAQVILEKAQQICPQLLLKARRTQDQGQEYSIQYQKKGARFRDEDLEKIYDVVRELGGQLTGSKIFYEDEDFE
jgi:hypothetical protein